MKRRFAQTGIKPLRRKAWRVLLLALLLTQPAWALHLCFCQPLVEPQHECCEANQATTPAVAHHCAETETPAEQNQFEDQPQTTAQCCDLTTEAATPATINAPPTPVVALAPYLPLAAPEVTAAAQVVHHPPPPTRPLYLAYSCLLI